MTPDVSGEAQPAAWCRAARQTICLGGHSDVHQPRARAAIHSDLSYATGPWRVAGARALLQTSGLGEISHAL